MTLKQQAIRGVIWSSVQIWGRQLITFAVFFLLARLLEPEAFGLIALANVFLVFVQIFVDQGFAQALIQRSELDPEHLDTAFWVNISIGVLMTAASIGASGIVAHAFKQPDLAPVLRWLSLVFLIQAFSSVQEALFKRNLAFRALAGRALTAISIGGIVGVSMAIAGFGVWSLVAQRLVDGIAKTVVLWWASKWRPRLSISFQHLKELLSFGLNVVGFQLFGFLNRRSDDLLIGYFLGPVALGYYTVAYRLLTMSIQILTTVTSQVAMPVFSKLQNNPEKLRQAFYKVTQYTSLISFPVFLGLALLAPEIVPLFFGEQWTASIPVMQILAFIGILQSVYYFNGSVIMAMGKPFWNLLLNMLNGITNVVGFYLVVRWGIVAVAAAFVIRGYLFSPISLLTVNRLIDISYKRYFGQFSSPIMASAAMASAILGLQIFFFSNAHGSLVLTTYILTGSLAYGVVIYLNNPRAFDRVVDVMRPRVSRYLGR